MYAVCMTFLLKCAGYKYSYSLAHLLTQKNFENSSIVVVVVTEKDITLLLCIYFAVLCPVSDTAAWV